MDPDATLAEARRIYLGVLYEKGEGDLERLSELFEALDNWLRNGGFLPADWRKGQAGS